MGQQKDRGGKQAEVKCKGDNGQYRMFSPVGARKGDDPVQNRAQAVFPAHVAVYELFLGVYQPQQMDEPVQAAADKNHDHYHCANDAYVEIPPYVNIPVACKI